MGEKLTQWRRMMLENFYFDISLVRDEYETLFSLLSGISWTVYNLASE